LYVEIILLAAVELTVTALIVADILAGRNWWKQC